MTEADWLVSDDPDPMMEFLRGKPSDRKLRLLACGVIRTAPIADDGQTMWDLVPTLVWFQQTSWQYRVDGAGNVKQTEDIVRVNCHDVIGIVEQAADTPGMEAALATAAFAGFAVGCSADPGHDPDVPPDSEFFYRIAGCFETAAKGPDCIAQWLTPPRHCLTQPQIERFFPAVTSLIRCIFGNPFRPATLESSCLTSTVVALAQGIYADRAFERLPILADALQDAGCDNDDILNHCRGEGPHARGCWVVDLVLGKA